MGVLIVNTGELLLHVRKEDTYTELFYLLFHPKGEHKCIGCDNK